MKRQIVLRSIVAGGVLVALLTAFVVFASPSSAEEATVVRVVDGDTVDVRVNGDQKRIRLLNIDTPESVDPSRPKECLSDEATAYTEALVAEGDVVNLEYDEEREDRYGRTLAHIRIADGRLVSSELARAGLGVPVVFGANDAQIAEVDEALGEAQSEQRGYFDSAQECTPAAQTVAAEKAFAQAMKVDPGSTVAEATAAAAAVAVILEMQSEFRKQLENGASLGIKAFVAVGDQAILTRALEGIEKIDQRQQSFVEEAADRKAAKKAAEAEARRKAAEDAARRAAEAAQPDPSSPKPRADSPANPYPGYTGPRCYAPGGKTWKPC